MIFNYNSYYDVIIIIEYPFYYDRIYIVHVLDIIMKCYLW